MKLSLKKTLNEIGPSFNRVAFAHKKYVNIPRLDNSIDDGVILLVYGVQHGTNKGVKVSEKVVNDSNITKEILEELRFMAFRHAMNMGPEYKITKIKIYKVPMDDYAGIKSPNARLIYEK